MLSGVISQTLLLMVSSKLYLKMQQNIAIDLT
nr:MAG TPA: hypothetical protein [Crassvirales sp.]